MCSSCHIAAPDWAQRHANSREAVGALSPADKKNSSWQIQVRLHARSNEALVEMYKHLSLNMEAGKIMNQSNSRSHNTAPSSRPLDRDPHLFSLFFQGAQ